MNFGLRLDEILYDYWARHRNCKDGCQSPDEGEITKQAITSLIKELVAEAKPDKRELIEPVTGKPVSRGDKVTVDVEADPRGSLIFAQNNGYNMALNQFEQNLLKALEEV